MNYRVGMPLWRVAARAGLPLRLRVEVHFDQESGTYWAESPDLDGLTVSGSSLDELRTEVLGAAETLLELALDDRPHRGSIRADMTVSSELRAA